MFKNAVIVMMVIAGLALASCSGGAGAPLDELNNTDNVSETQSLPHAQDGELSSIEWTAAELDAPVMPRDASDWQDLFDPGVILDELFEAMHYTVGHGENDVPVDNYMGFGGGASYAQILIGFEWDGFNPVPVYGYALTLASTEDVPAFASFGFKGFPAGERLTGVEVSGSAGEIFIGVAGYGNKDAYRWFGPYDLTEGTASLELPFMDSTNDSNHGYVTLLTHGGNTAIIEDVKVFVGEQTLVPDIDFDFDVDIIPDWDL